MSIYDKSSLVLIPSGTKTGKVYSQKPVSGDGDFTFTRSSAATRVNADGNIEKETQNLILQSNQFDTTWNPQSGITLTANQAGYDGTNDAWKFEKNASSYRNIAISISVSGVYTTSLYAKAGTLNLLTIRDGSNQYARFYLNTGTYTLSNSPVSGAMVDVGNGWYRCSVTMTTSNPTIQIYPDWNQTTAGYIYIQDAQIEQGLVARDYIETTTTAVEGGITDNVPRLDYTDSSCPALLLEPQRSNKIVHSEYFGSWSIFDNATIEDNFGTSPEGVQNAAKIGSGGGGNDFIYVSQPVTIGTAYTTSCFVKNIDSTRTGIYGVNVTNFVVNWNGAEIDSVAGTNVDYEDYGNGWYRVWQTSTATGTSSVMRFYSHNEGARDGSVLLYGYQVEEGSYATSYIPTYGSSVTRTADVDCETANPDTSLFGQTEGTIFCEYTPVSDDTTNQSRFIRLRNSSNSNQIYMQHNALNNINAVVFNGSNQFVGQTSTGYASVGNTYKFALAYKDGDYAFYANGVQIDTGTATGLGTLAVDRLDLDNVNISKSSKVNQALVFKTRLSNEELAALTTI